MEIRVEYFQYKNTYVKFKMYKLYLTCNWDSNENLSNHWRKQMDTSNTRVSLTNIRDEADFYIVFNKPNQDEGDYNFMNKKTILIRMEPNMEKNTHLWGPEWSNPSDDLFYFVIKPPKNLNFVEWHISKSFDELLSSDYSTEKTKGNIVSVIISDRYYDEGQIKRIDFIKYLQKYYSDKIELDVYGRGDLNKWGIQNHKGELPIYKKDDGLIPYKYHFNCENASKINYVTEKLYDGIMTNTLVFYSGCKNVCSIFPDKGFVNLDLDDFKLAAEILLSYINNDEYGKRQEDIHKLKIHILKNLSFSNRLSKLINI